MYMYKNQQYLHKSLEYIHTDTGTISLEYIHTDTGTIYLHITGIYDDVLLWMVILLNANVF